jgi:hypothetical protein
VEGGERRARAASRVERAAGGVHGPRSRARARGTRAGPA